MEVVPPWALPAEVVPPWALPVEVASRRALPVKVALHWADLGVEVRGPMERPTVGGELCERAGRMAFRNDEIATLPMAIFE